MRISSLTLRNFKRFTDFAIRDIPATAKLVLVVGPNGSGKSSLFDALIHWHRHRTGLGIHNDELYYRKDRAVAFDWGQIVDVQLHAGDVLNKSSLYVRSAYRNDPDFTIGGLSRLHTPSDAVRINRSIDTDQSVSENYQRLVYSTVTGVYNTANDLKTVQMLREELIGSVRDSMKRVFGDLTLNNISDPLGEGTFFFEKGTTKRYHYKNLSGGEKATFDLLLDMHTKRSYFANAIYGIDEVETHVHTAVQGALLRELVSVLPGDSQMWVTTHSLGVMRAALELAAEKPDSVALIDFHGVTPDAPTELRPSHLGRATWEKLLSIALDNLSPRVAPKHIVMCEGSSVGTRRRDFDADIYNRIFASQVSDVVFVSGGGSQQVRGSSDAIAQTLRSVLPTSTVRPLIDRDDRSNSEVQALVAAGTLVLGYRNLESYLLADEVLAALAASLKKEHLLPDMVALKVASLANSVSRGNASDDLKSAAGEIYVGLKRLLGLIRCGNNTDEFLRDTLAPLITPTMTVYLHLRSSVLDALQ